MDTQSEEQPKGITLDPKVRKAAREAAEKRQKEKAQARKVADQIIETQRKEAKERGLRGMMPRIMLASHESSRREAMAAVVLKKLAEPPRENESEEIRIQRIVDELSSGGKKVRELQNEGSSEKDFNKALVSAEQTRRKGRSLAKAIQGMDDDASQAVAVIVKGFAASSRHSGDKLQNQSHTDVEGKYKDLSQEVKNTLKTHGIHSGSDFAEGVRQLARVEQETRDTFMFANDQIDIAIHTIIEQVAATRSPSVMERVRNWLHHEHPGLGLIADRAKLIATDVLPMVAGGTIVALTTLAGIAATSPAFVVAIGAVAAAKLAPLAFRTMERHSKFIRETEQDAARGVVYDRDGKGLGVFIPKYLRFWNQNETRKAVMRQKATRHMRKAEDITGNEGLKSNDTQEKIKAIADYRARQELAVLYPDREFIKFTSASLAQQESGDGDAGTQALTEQGLRKAKHELNQAVDTAYAQLSDEQKNTLDTQIVSAKEAIMEQLRRDQGSNVIYGTWRVIGNLLGTAGAASGFGAFLQGYHAVAEHGNIMDGVSKFISPDTWGQNNIFMKGIHGAEQITQGRALDKGTNIFTALGRIYDQLTQPPAQQGEVVQPRGVGGGMGGGARYGAVRLPASALESSVQQGAMQPAVPQAPIVEAPNVPVVMKDITMPDGKTVNFPDGVTLSGKTLTIPFGDGSRNIENVEIISKQGGAGDYMLKGKIDGKDVIIDITEKTVNTQTKLDFSTAPDVSVTHAGNQTGFTPDLSRGAEDARDSVLGSWQTAHTKFGADGSVSIYSTYPDAKNVITIGGKQWFFEDGTFSLKGSGEVVLRNLDGREIRLPEKTLLEMLGYGDQKAIKAGQIINDVYAQWSLERGITGTLNASDRVGQYMTGQLPPDLSQRIAGALNQQGIAPSDVRMPTTGIGAGLVDEGANRITMIAQSQLHTGSLTAPSEITTQQTSLSVTADALRGALVAPTSPGISNPLEGLNIPGADVGLRVPFTTAVEDYLSGNVSGTTAAQTAVDMAFVGGGAELVRRVAAGRLAGNNAATGQQGRAEQRARLVRNVGTLGLAPLANRAFDGINRLGKNIPFINQFVEPDRRARVDISEALRIIPDNQLAFLASALNVTPPQKGANRLNPFKWSNAANIRTEIARHLLKNNLNAEMALIAVAEAQEILRDAQTVPAGGATPPATSAAANTQAAAPRGASPAARVTLNALGDLQREVKVNDKNLRAGDVLVGKMQKMMAVAALDHQTDIFPDGNGGTNTSGVAFFKRLERQDQALLERALGVKCDPRWVKGKDYATTGYAHIVRAIMDRIERDGVPQGITATGANDFEKAIAYLREKAKPSGFTSDADVIKALDELLPPKTAEEAIQRGTQSFNPSHAASALLGAQNISNLDIDASQYLNSQSALDPKQLLEKLRAKGAQPTAGSTPSLADRLSAAQTEAEEVLKEMIPVKNRAEFLAERAYDSLSSPQTKTQVLDKVGEVLCKLLVVDKSLTASDALDALTAQMNKLNSSGTLTSEERYQFVTQVGMAWNPKITNNQVNESQAIKWITDGFIDDKEKIIAALFFMRSRNGGRPINSTDRTLKKLSDSINKQANATRYADRILRVMEHAGINTTAFPDALHSAMKELQVDSDIKPAIAKHLAEKILGSPPDKAKVPDAYNVILGLHQKSELSTSKTNEEIQALADSLKEVYIRLGPTKEVLDATAAALREQINIHTNDKDRAALAVETVQSYLAPFTSPSKDNYDTALKLGYMAYGFDDTPSASDLKKWADSMSSFITASSHYTDTQSAIDNVLSDRVTEETRVTVWYRISNDIKSTIQKFAPLTDLNDLTQMDVLKKVTCALLDEGVNPKDIRTELKNIYSAILNKAPVNYNEILHKNFPTISSVKELQEALTFSGWTYDGSIPQIGQSRENLDSYADLITQAYMNKAPGLSDDDFMSELAHLVGDSLSSSNDKEEMLKHVLNYAISGPWSSKAGDSTAMTGLVRLALASAGYAQTASLTQNEKAKLNNLITHEVDTHGNLTDDSVKAAMKGVVS